MKDYHFGLLGYPIDYSCSPSMHREAFRAVNLHGSYELFAVPPTSQGHDTLQELLVRMRHSELHGLNVTIPYKITVIRYLDELTQTARAIGAVNAILARDGTLVGENFDCPAFMADLSYVLEQANLGSLAHQPGRRALVLGAGGAARAVIYGLLEAGWQVLVAVRRLEAAEDVRHGFEEFTRLSVCQITKLASQYLEGTGLIVNATPMGMLPNTNASAWPGDLAMPAGALVYDLVYNPPETALICAARCAGLPAFNGLGMLARQAALSFQAWTGQLPDWRALYRLAIPEGFSITLPSNLAQERKA